MRAKDRNWELDRCEGELKFESVSTSCDGSCSFCSILASRFPSPSAAAQDTARSPNILRAFD